MRNYLFVVICISSAFLHSGNVCSAATVYLSASASTDGWLSSRNGWASSSTTWIIKAPLGQKVLLSFDELQIDYSGYSCGTYLEVRDGQYSWSSLLTKQCDTSTPPSPVYSSGRWLYVTFNVRYGSSFYDRVSAKYRALLAYSAGCPKALLGNNTGVIYSPGFPNNYPSNTNCCWTISAPWSYNYLLLNFTVLKLKYSYYGCYNDYVIVRDGKYSWSNQLAKYCSSTYSPVVLVPSGRDARVEFKSDFYGSAKGFLLFIRFTDSRYTTTAAPPVTWWPTTAWWWTTPTPYQWWGTTPHLDSTHRMLAILLPIVVGVILMFVIIAVLVCEKGKRLNIPRPLGPTPPVVELQTFSHQVPVPTQQPQQYADESRAELAGQTGRELPPPYQALA